MGLEMENRLEQEKSLKILCNIERVIQMAGDPAKTNMDVEILDAIKALDVRISDRIGKLEKSESNYLKSLDDNLKENSAEHLKMAKDIEEILALMTQFTHGMFFLSA